jgi:hypothetical protein
VSPKEPKKPRAKVYTSRSRKILNMATFAAVILGIVTIIVVVLLIIASFAGSS